MPKFYGVSKMTNVKKEQFGMCHLHIALILLSWQGKKHPVPIYTKDQFNIGVSEQLKLVHMAHKCICGNNFALYPNHLSRIIHLYDCIFLDL